MTSSEETKRDSPEAQDETCAVGQTLKVVGFTLLGMAVAVPAICLYLGKRLRERATPKRKRETEEKPRQVTPEPIRIPVRSAAPSEAEEAPAPPPEPTSPAPEAQKPLYVGSTDSDKFHKPECRWARQIQEENRIAFKSRQDAIEGGYHPCGSCRP